MADKKDKHVESALAKLNKPVRQTSEDVLHGNDADAKPAKVGWASELAAKMDHRTTTHRH